MKCKRRVEQGHDRISRNGERLIYLETHLSSLTLSQDNLSRKSPKCLEAYLFELLHCLVFTCTESVICVVVKYMGDTVLDLSCEKLPLNLSLFVAHKIW